MDDLKYQHIAERLNQRSAVELEELARPFFFLFAVAIVVAVVGALL